jgi:hypothetical protein
VLRFSGVPLLIEFAIYIDQDLKLLIVGADLKFVIGAGVCAGLAVVQMNNSTTLPSF